MSSGNLTAVIQNADGTTVPVTPIWSVTPATAGSISSTGVFTASSVTVDVNAVATASFTHEGQALTATYALKIVNVPTPSRTCIGTIVNSRTETLRANFEVIPDNRKINVRLTAELGSPYFLPSYFFFVQGTNTVDLSLVEFDADTAVFVPANGWSGYSRIPTPGVKEGVIAAVPVAINLAQPFQISYSDTTTSCN